MYITDTRPRMGTIGKPAAVMAGSSGLILDVRIPGSAASWSKASPDGSPAKVERGTDNAPA